MQCNIYVLFDKKLGRYMTPPLFVRDDREAVTTVTRVLPAQIIPDLQMEFRGTFDDKSGEVVPCKPLIVSLEVKDGE